MLIREAKTKYFHFSQFTGQMQRQAVAGGTVNNATPAYSNKKLANIG